MDGILIAFSVQSGKNKTKSSAFIKAFYGQDTSSHQGKYRYHRHGLLDEIPHRKLIRGVIVIRPQDEKKVKEFLKNFSAEIYIREIRLTEDDKAILEVPKE